ncbi:ubiquitin-like domain-containing protein CIP73 isoform X1 [Cryptomeria japonica]|uniref:ubiquitin-like domain-containing protein CIP73 isoform X1 n=1 Tax=Cryptomeria japonica TaxID=3369 RepID=UPI0027DAB247|nr:ubiquitin-like domain-containing protein CIP73 isoform X1 [Cryptomeria japonica]XP_057872083.2 ubiquitin-like domain-containing protein CIP73 isoform X1 [Cryptomeria japonica]XP_057872084.2 ubiquitin-like domain-containing protein CIP73 isoform X1 [Cryptomeria japonica]
MADCKGNEITISERDQGECSDPTVEIKIKTLDSQTYTIRVNKFLPVPALKEQIATVTGVLSEQQRLICRGKVLKDDQLLSAYHVEDGHTLHLVVRQPLQQPPLSTIGTGGSDGYAEQQGSTRNRSGQVSHSVVLGTFNITDQADGAIPDVNRFVSAVLNSIGIGNVLPISPGVGNGSNVILQGTGFESQQRTTNATGRVDVNPTQSDHASDIQSDPIHGSFRLSPTSLLRPLNQATVISDSLTTLSLYLNRMRHEFSLISPENQSQATSQSSEAEALRSASVSPLIPGGLPTPAALGAVIRHTQQFLNDQAGSSLSQLARQLEGESSVIDPMVRDEIQSSAMRNGIIMQNLGALLLELGRTTMTLRMGQSPAESVVNAGPAVFVSTTGPNPLMVQALPFQPGSSFGSIPIGATHPGTAGLATTGDSLRNIEMHIHTVAPGAGLEQRERGSVQQVEGQGNQIASPQGGVLGREGVSSFNSESGAVRVVPVRIAAVPAAITGEARSESSSSSHGFFYPLLARFQQLNPLQLSQVRNPPPTLSPGNLTSGTDAAQQHSLLSIPLSAIRTQVQVQTSPPTDRNQEDVEHANSSVHATLVGETQPSVHGVLQSQAGLITEQGLSQQRPSSVHVYSIHLGPHNMQGDYEQSNGGISDSEGSTLAQLPPGVGQIFSGMMSEGQAGSGTGNSVDLMSHIHHNSTTTNISRPAADQTRAPIAISDVVLQALQNPFPSSQLQMSEQIGERSQNRSELYSGLHGDNATVDYLGLLQRLMPNLPHVVGRESEASASHHEVEGHPKASSSEGPSSSYSGEAQPGTSTDMQCSSARNGAEIPRNQNDTDNSTGNENLQSDTERQHSDRSHDAYSGGSPASKRRKEYLANLLSQSLLQHLSKIIQFP